jgi:hypothetical protein
MKAPQYILEIYQPGSVSDVWMTLRSTAPFGAIARGDIIDPGSLAGCEINPESIPVVTGIEHLLSGTAAGVAHKICVYTNEVANTPALRQGTSPS